MVGGGVANFCEHNCFVPFHVKSLQFINDRLPCLLRLMITINYIILFEL